MSIAVSEDTATATPRERFQVTYWLKWLQELVEKRPRKVTRRYASTQVKLLLQALLKVFKTEVHQMQCRYPKLS